MRCRSGQGAGEGAFGDQGAFALVSAALSLLFFGLRSSA